MYLIGGRKALLYPVQLVSGATSSVTFDPAHKSADLALTPDNLTVSNTVGTAFRTVFGTSAVSNDGTYSVDYTMNGSPASSGLILGVINSSASTSVAMDSGGVSGFGCDLSSSGSIAGTQSGTGPTFTTGNTVRMQLVISGGGTSRVLQFKNVTTAGSFLPVSGITTLPSGPLFFGATVRFSGISMTISNINWS